MDRDFKAEQPVVFVEEFENADIILDDNCSGQEKEQDGLKGEIRALAQVSIKKKSSI